MDEFYSFSLASLKLQSRHSRLVPVLQLFQFLCKNFLQAIRFAAKRGTRANINATMDHMEKLDVSEQ